MKEWNLWAVIIEYSRIPIIKLQHTTDLQYIWHITIITQLLHTIEHDYSITYLYALHLMCTRDLAWRLTKSRAIIPGIYDVGKDNVFVCAREG
jgi:hypothetical protein